VGIKTPAANPADYASVFTRRRLGDLPTWIAYPAARRFEHYQALEALVHCRLICLWILLSEGLSGIQSATGFVCPTPGDFMFGLQGTAGIRKPRPTPNPTNSSARALCNAHLHKVVTWFRSKHAPSHSTSAFRFRRRLPVPINLETPSCHPRGPWIVDSVHPKAGCRRPKNRPGIIPDAIVCATIVCRSLSVREAFLLEPPSHMDPIAFVLEEPDGKPSRRSFEFATQSISRHHPFHSIFATESPTPRLERGWRLVDDVGRV